MRSRVLVFGCLVSVLTVAGAFAGSGVERQDQLLKGFAEEVSGETIVYHSPHPDASAALLVRSLDRKKYIEWKTEAVPRDIGEKSATFVLLAGIDANEDSHSFDLSVNGKRLLSFANPLRSSEEDWAARGKGGAELEFKTVMVDRYDDLFGYVFLKVPKSFFRRGEALHVRVEGESAGSRSWFMVFKLGLEQKITLRNENAVLRGEAKPRQNVRVDIIHLGEPTGMRVSAEGVESEGNLRLGHNVFRLSVPATAETREAEVEIRIEGQAAVRKAIFLKPATRKDIYLIHHSHVDIGYTDVQEEVERKQWDNLEAAMEIARRTEGYPAEARFKWNTEVMWPVETYLEKAPPEKRERLLEAMRRGWIEPGALFANELTGLCSDEELMRLPESARRVAGECGITADTALISDIPGFTWGIVPALAHSGVRYLSIGTNTGHRIGYVLSEWGDRPFYWVSPSGGEKVLCWVAGKGYSWFHTGLGYSKVTNRLNENAVFEYLAELEAKNYPYDIVCVRYNIGSDNGPPDPELPDIVRGWNEKYESPRLIIASAGEMFREFERRYGDELPVVSGDFTGHWEDGAASTARETAQNRRAAERLTQAEALWAMRNPQGYPAAEFCRAWRYVLLYDEHTWGAWNSISDPEDEFVVKQWENKRAFVLEADRLSRGLLEGAIGSVETACAEVGAVDVYNTDSWERDDVVVLHAETAPDGIIAKDEEKNPLPSQRLSDGRLAVLVRGVPPFGGKRLFLDRGPAWSGGKAKAEGNELSNGLIRVRVDEASGAIANIECAGISGDLVETKAGPGLNDYLYVAGRNPDNPQRNGKVKIEVKEQGPLVATLLITSDAPGCNVLIREVTVIDGLARIDITDTLDKKNVYEQEAVRLAFPFNVPDGQVRIDLAWGWFRPESDQLPGSCKNYFTALRWVDVSNQDYGVTLSTADAPLLEIGGLYADPVVVGWKKSAEHSSRIYSYVMNNYWETNYKASQAGPAVFRYSILPHGMFNPGAAERFGMERCRPLIVVAVDKECPHPKPLLRVEPAGVLVSSLKPSEDGGGLILRLFNAGGKPEEVRLIWEGRVPEGIYGSSPFEERGEAVTGTLELPAYGIATLRIEF
jgi:alpha-mannosidase